MIFFQLIYLLHHLFIISSEFNSFACLFFYSTFCYNLFLHLVLLLSLLFIFFLFYFSFFLKSNCFQAADGGKWNLCLAWMVIWRDVKAWFDPQTKSGVHALWSESGDGGTRLPADAVGGQSGSRGRTTDRSTDSDEDGSGCTKVCPPMSLQCVSAVNLS